SGATWTLVAGDVTSASTRLCYDATRQRVVLWCDPGPVLREWNGTAWSTVLQTGLPQLTAPALWHDPVAGRTVIAAEGLGGVQLTWDGTALQIAGHARADDAVWFFDPVRGRGVLFGGQRSPIDLDETWTWDGLHWSVMVPATRPPPRTHAVSTFDS